MQCSKCGSGRSNMLSERRERTLVTPHLYPVKMAGEAELESPLAAPSGATRMTPALPPSAANKVSPEPYFLCVIQARLRLLLHFPTARGAERSSPVATFLPEAPGHSAARRYLARGPLEFSHVIFAHPSPKVFSPSKVCIFTHGGGTARPDRTGRLWVQRFANTLERAI